MRERLIELLSRYYGVSRQDEGVMTLAEWLLDNGMATRGWFPVEKRLPSVTYGDVIAFSTEHSDYLLGRLVETEENGIVCIGDGVQLYNVTHWTPLPEPPKEG